MASEARFTSISLCFLSGHLMSMTPEQLQAWRWEREIDERNRPLTDEELDAMFPEGYKVGLFIAFEFSIGIKKRDHNINALHLYRSCLPQQVMCPSVLQRVSYRLHQLLLVA